MYVQLTKLDMTVDCTFRFNEYTHGKVITSLSSTMYLYFKYILIITQSKCDNNV